MIVAACLFLILLTGIYTFLHLPPFGRLPTGKALDRIRSSAQYKNGQFHNLHFTPQLTDGVTMAGAVKEFFFGKDRRNKPSSPLPSQKTNLFQPGADDDLLVWFGHSSYYMQVAGKRFLIDPVLSGHASPVKFTTPAFKGADVYRPDDMPVIDYLLLTHDHYDHLDYDTLIALKGRVKKIITGLGVGAHLRRWGYDEDLITEMDWNEKLELGIGMTLHTVPARHFSGRSLKRNTSLWLSFVLRSPKLQIFLGGDSGYDTHFRAIGQQFGTFDMAILENGQYNRHWKYIHLMPEETVQAAIDLNAKKILPVHWGKFSLSLHAWDEPIIRITQEAEKKGVAIFHPMIGEIVPLKEFKIFSRWWEGIP
jgi:L-ascorbate metabolism protein UlaG (beta-lactamase superfamily)